MNVQRVFATIDQNSSGSSSVSVNFTDTEHIALTIDRNVTLNITMPEKSKCYLTINKGSSDIVSLYSVTVEDGRQYGATVLIYELFKSNSQIYAKRFNNQSVIVKTIGALSSSYGTVIDFKSLNCTINGNIAAFSGSFVYETSAERDSYTINYTSWGLSFKNSRYEAAAAQITDNSTYVMIPCSIMLLDTIIFIEFATDIPSGTELDIYFTASIPII